MVKVKENLEKKSSYLVLEDGSIFEGTSFGAVCDSDGEIGKLLV